MSHSPKIGLEIRVLRQRGTERVDERPQKAKGRRRNYRGSGRSRGKSCFFQDGIDKNAEQRQDEDSKKGSADGVISTTGWRSEGFT